MITSGFFASVNGDRKRTGSFLAQWIHSLVSNGVYNGDFAIAAGENMNVILPLGQAWINGYYCHNDGNITLPIANADGVLKRKDTVVLRWDINTRDIDVKVLTGTFASNPVAPPIVRNAEQYDLKLAEIDVAAGAIKITQSMISDMRLDNTVCGLVHAVVDHIDTTTLFNQLQAYIVEHEAQFNADMAAFKSQSGADFSTWFDSIKGILGKDEAGNLLNLINSHTSNATLHTTQAEKDKIAQLSELSLNNQVNCVKNGTVFELTNVPLGTSAGNTYLISFFTKWDFNAGDTFTINGVASANTLTLDNKPLPDKAFAAWMMVVMCVRGGPSLNMLYNSHAASADTASNTIPISTPALRNIIAIPKDNSIPSGLPNGTVILEYTP